jgi:hypothetical protein
MENKYGNKNGIKIKNIKIISQENNQFQIIVNLLKKCKLLKKAEFQDQELLCPIMHSDIFSKNTNKLLLLSVHIKKKHNEKTTDAFFFI